MNNVKRSPGNGAGALITSVTPGSVADELGLQPGDVIIAANDKPLRDILDFQYETVSGVFTLLVRRGNEESFIDIEMDEDERLGVEFASPLFDGLRICRNRCRFCFIKQMPPGMRRSLYIRDDDYRYSFLYGNFITLTNLNGNDWQRLAEQRLSPLYISVHATEQDLRNTILGITEHPSLLDKLHRLGENNLSFHAQIVLVPGLNDDAHLERTISDLLSLPNCLSVAVVPVGLTKYAASGLRSFTSAEAQKVLAQITVWRTQLIDSRKQPIVYAADEWFLLAGADIPPAAYYADFPQAENGVGLTRIFLDQWKRAKRRLSKAKMTDEPRLVVCGVLIAPVWQKVAAEMNTLGANVTILPVVNRSFGETVTVSGLLCAGDVIATLAKVPSKAAIYLPRAMFNSKGTMTLDDYSLAQIQSELGRQVAVASAAADIFKPLPA